MSKTCWGCNQPFDGPGTWHPECLERFQAEQRRIADEAEARFKERNKRARTFYLVTEGEYSDYQVIALFSTREKAESWMQYGQGDTILEMLLDPPEAELIINRGLKLFLVRMRKDGQVHAVEDAFPLNVESHNDEQDKKKWSFSKVGYGPNPGVEMGCWIMAKDQQHAIKIMNDRRAQLIASGEWDEREAEELRRYEEIHGESDRRWAAEKAAREAELAARMAKQATAPGFGEKMGMADEAWTWLEAEANRDPKDGLDHNK